MQRKSMVVFPLGGQWGMKRTGLKSRIYPSKADALRGARKYKTGKIVLLGEDGYKIIRQTPGYRAPEGLRPGVLDPKLIARAVSQVVLQRLVAESIKAPAPKAAKLSIANARKDAMVPPTAKKQSSGKTRANVQE